MPFTILYGIVTDIDLRRASHFTDYLPGIEKKIFININGTEYVYDQSYKIKINTEDFKIHTEIADIDSKLFHLHSKLKINYGSFCEELPEQKMAVRYLTGNEKVLEIGANIGRNSLIISSIVGDDNLVALESDIIISNQLKENRDINGFTFHIEASALSNRKLIQCGWNTKPSDILEEGFSWVNTINLIDLKNKYNINFDTLILDCEGAFYYILIDMPELLDNINLIIMENDYYDINEKEYVDSILTKYNFYNDYREAGGWGCCYNNFFEVWKKN